MHYSLLTLSPAFSHSQSILFNSLPCIIVFSISRFASHSQSDFGWLTCMHCNLISLSCGVTFTIFALLDMFSTMPSLSFSVSFSLAFFYHSLIAFPISLCCFKSTLLLFSHSLLFSRILISMMEKKQLAMGVSELQNLDSKVCGNFPTTKSFFRLRKKIPTRGWGGGGSYSNLLSEIVFFLEPKYLICLE